MLDELVNTIETLKARTNEHRTALQASEAQTRLSLIDPLLRALGWDTADPALVRPEFTLSGGRADYALLGEAEKPVAIMEAKRLNEALGTMDRRMQMLTYANFSNVAYAGLSDGDQWVLYRVFDQKPLEDRLVLDLSIVNLPAHESALKLLLLWRPNLASGQPIEASEPLLDPEPPQPPRPTPPIPPTPPPPPPTAQGWKSLADYEHMANAKPAKLRLPGGEEIPVTEWADLLFELAKWLVRDRVLTPDKCPVSVGKNEVIYRESSRVLRDWEQSRPLPQGLCLITNGSAWDKVRRCRGILNALGIDPATVHVQVG